MRQYPKEEMTMPVAYGYSILHKNISGKWVLSVDGTSSSMAKLVAYHNKAAHSKEHIENATKLGLAKLVRVKIETVSETEEEREEK